MKKGILALSAILLIAITDCCTAGESNKLVIINGSMEEGSDHPIGWRLESGSLSRDTKIFNNGGASLKITVNSGKALAFQQFNGGSDLTYTIKGVVKSQGEIKVNVALQTFNDDWTKNQFFQLKYLQNNQNWQEFTKSITLPNWTARFRILILAEGNGSAWLDDVASENVDKLAEQKDATLFEEPQKGKPWEAACGFYPNYPYAWKNKLNQNIKRTAQGDIDVVFYGDSLTEGWAHDTQGSVVFNEKYKPLKAVNYGIGGDGTRQILYRIQAGELKGISPKVIILMIGTNNLYDDFNAGSDKEIAKAIKEITRQIQIKSPKTRILLQAILPRGNEYFHTRIKNINKIIKTYADGDRIQYLDMSNEFKNQDDKIKEKLYANDKLHLNKNGYRQWDIMLYPKLIEMLKK